MHFSFRAGANSILVLFALCFFAVAQSVYAATYYVDATGGNDGNDGLTTGTAWQTLDKVSSSTFSAGDIIDGLGSVFSGQYQAGGNIINRLVIPSSGSEGGGYITFRNFTVDGSLSFDGLLTINPTNTYSSTSAWSAYGAGDTSGEIYKKTMTRAPYQLFEDGIKLTPIITTDAAGALALTRGQYTWNGILLYYRASDGAAPSTHAIRGSRRDIDGQLGLIYSSGKSYIKLENIVTKNHDPNTAGSWSIYISGGDHVLIDNVECTANNKGLEINGATDVVLSSINIHDNISGGILIEGSVSDLDLSGTIATNGRYLHYDGANILYKNDGDGIGIGGTGGALSNITIHDSTITDNGPPDGDSTLIGAGVYVGTANPMSISNLNILRNRISGNHNQGLGMGTISNGFFGGSFVGNAVYDNSNYDGSGTANAFHVGVCEDPCAGVTVANNVFAFNDGYSTLYVKNSDALSSYTIVDNSFYNNGTSSTYRGDLWPQYAVDNVTEKHNHFYRSGTAWDAVRVIERAGVTYDRDHIVGSSAGFWQFDTGLGQNDAVNVNDFNNPGGFDFSLRYSSPAIDAGTTTTLHTATSTDYLGNPIYGTPDISAIEYQPPYTIGTNDIPVTGSVRLYADGKYREVTASSSATTADLAVAPEGGWGSGDYREYMDIAIDTWTATSMAWTATSSIATTTVFTLGGLTPNGWYDVARDGATTSSITGASCVGTKCQADGSGNISLTYSGGWSTHTFTLTEGTTPFTGGGALLNPGGGGGSSKKSDDDTVPASTSTTTVGTSAASSTGNPTPCNLSETVSPTGDLSVSALIKLLFTTGIIPTDKQTKACEALQNVTSDTDTQSTAGNNTLFTTPLKKGDRSDEVRRLQQFLNAHGFVLTADGPGSPGNETDLFGLLTFDAVKRFQATYAAGILVPVGLTAPSGFWGPSSIKKANALLSQ